MFGVFVALVVFIIFIAVATHLLWPLPLLSYQQGEARQELGTVVRVAKIRPGITEVGVTHNLLIDPALQTGNFRVASASFTSFVYFRGNQKIPNIGDDIQVTSINRYYPLTTYSYNWVTNWELHKESMPVVGLVTSI